jgi:hypothetical protein
MHVVVGEVALLDRDLSAVAGFFWDSLFAFAPRPGVLDRGDGAVRTEAAAMARDLLAGAAHHDPVEIHGDVDSAPDGPGVHRVVAGPEAHVVVPA